MANKDVSAIESPLYIGNGANRSRFDTDGSHVLEGDATCYDDVQWQLTGSNLFSTAGKADYDFDESCVVLQPSGSLDTDGDCVVLSFQMPHSAKENSNFHLHLHYEQTDALIRTFKYRYRLQENGSLKTTAWSSDITVSTTTDGVNAFTYVSGTLNQIASLGDIAIAGLSSIVQVRLARTDATAGDLNVSFIDGHVEKDSPAGSRSEYVK